MFLKQILLSGVKITLTRPKHGWNNVELDVKEISCEGVAVINVVKCMDKETALV